jgi:hypothetical protein
MSYEIEDVLRSVQGGAPAPHTTTDDIIGRAKRKRARRTAGAAAVGVAACLGIVLVAVNVPGGNSGNGGNVANGGIQAAGHPAASAPTGPPPAETPLPVKQVDFSSTLGNYRVGPYQVGSAGQVTAGYQQMPVYKDGETWTDDGLHTDYPYAGATLTVYRPGVYDPGSFTFGEDYTLKVGDQYAVKVGDRPAIAIDMINSVPGDESTKFVRTALAWQYEDGAWATLIPNYFHAALPRADAVQIAAGLVTSAKKHELKVPYKLGYLPKGWQAVGVSQTPAATSSMLSSVYLHQGPLANPATVLDASAPWTVSIGVSKGKTKEHLVEGLNCFAGRHECWILHGAYVIGVSSWNVPDATVKKIAEGLQLKNPADQNTWVPVN